jgi:hypothetical protein
VVLAHEIAVPSRPDAVAADQVPPVIVLALPLESTAAQNVGFGHEIAVVIPAARPAGNGSAGRGADHAVPF